MRYFLNLFASRSLGLFPLSKRVIPFGIWMGILLFSSCNKTDLSPVLGTYTGEAMVVKWDYEELRDTEGNLTGIIVTRDTLFSQQDVFMVRKGSKKNLITISGGGNLAQLNSFSDHEFSYDGQKEFSLVQQTNGVETKRLEFTFDGSGQVTVYFIENFFDVNRPPVGQEINFSGVSE